MHLLFAVAVAAGASPVDVRRSAPVQTVPARQGLGTWRQVQTPSVSIVRAKGGDFWVTSGYPLTSVARITPRGKVTEFSIGEFAAEIAQGADRRFYLNDQKYQFELRVFSPKHGLTSFRLSDNANGGISLGGDGNIWFVEDTHIGRLTPQGALTEYPTGQNAGLTGVTWGPDGLLWFGSSNASHWNLAGLDLASGAIATHDKIASLNPAIGVVAIYNFPYIGNGGPIVFDDHGNLWYALVASMVQLVEVNLKTLQVHTYQAPGDFHPYESPRDLAFAPDGELWYTAQHIVNGRVNGGGFVRFNVQTKVFTTFATPNGYPWLSDFAFGPGNEVWAAGGSSVVVFAPR